MSAIHPKTDAADAQIESGNACRLCQSNQILTQPTLPTVSFSRGRVTRRLWKSTLRCVDYVGMEKPTRIAPSMRQPNNAVRLTQRQELK